MIDRVEVVIEARQRHFARAQAATVSESSLHQQDVEAGAGKVASEDQPVVSGADDDAVIGLFQRFGQKSDILSTAHLWDRQEPKSAGGPPRRSMAAAAWSISGNTGHFETNRVVLCRGNIVRD
jgi:hypothetical protein